MAIVQVRTFARYAELLGDPVGVEIELPTTVANLIVALRRMPGGDRLPNQPLVAVDHAVAGTAAVVSLGSSVALLPPLAGG